MAGVSTDTVGLRVRPNSFVVKRGSSILNEKLLDNILGKKPKKYAGGETVPIRATPEERIATPEEVAMYGIDFFRAINNSSDNAAHNNIDELIWQSENVMKPMYGGGEVAPGYQDGGVAGYQEGDEVGLYPEPGKPGRYKDPIHRYLSDMILAGKADEMGQLLNDSYYRQLVEQEMKFMQIQNLVQSAEEALPTYTGKKEGLDLGDIFGEQSWLKQRGEKKSIRNVEDIMGEMPFGQRRSELFEKGLYGLGYQGGGGVGEAGRAYPPGTLMSPFWGDTAPAPEAQDATATTPFQSPAQAAEFARMIKMLMAQAALQEAKQASEVGEAEKIEWDGKSVLPPWEGKRNFKGNLYEDNIEFRVPFPENPQIYSQ